jgi:hypothetical protein
MFDVLRMALYAYYVHYARYKVARSTVSGGGQPVNVPRRLDCTWYVFDTILSSRSGKVEIM